MKTHASLFLFVASIFADVSLAQREDKPQIATQIESVRLQVENDGEKAYFHFSEGVVLTGTNMRVECDDLEVFASREAEQQSEIGKFSAIKEIIATGHVRIIQEERTATCEKAVVQPNEERIVLSGNPVVVQPSGRLVTYNPEDEIVLDRGNGRISINTKGPRKLRLTGSAISDLGFENKGPIPTNGTEADEDGSETEKDGPDEDSEEPSEEAEESELVDEGDTPKTEQPETESE